ncbi:hypothetical protein MMC28_002577 [Mycoblastus sanguinarius]|nr:hypothetical protein [Mycoblastus sanguinarius]
MTAVGNEITQDESQSRPSGESGEVNQHRNSETSPFDPSKLSVLAVPSSRAQSTGKRRQSVHNYFKHFSDDEPQDFSTGHPSNDAPKNAPRPAKPDWTSLPGSSRTTYRQQTKDTRRDSERDELFFPSHSSPFCKGDDQQHGLQKRSEYSQVEPFQAVNDRRLGHPVTCSKPVDSLAMSNPKAVAVRIPSQKCSMVAGSEPRRGVEGPMSTNNSESTEHFLTRQAEDQTTWNNGLGTPTRQPKNERSSWSPSDEPVHKNRDPSEQYHQSHVVPAKRKNSSFSRELAGLYKISPPTSTLYMRASLQRKQVDRRSRSAGHNGIQSAGSTESQQASHSANSDEGDTSPNGEKRSCLPRPSPLLPNRHHHKIPPSSKAASIPWTTRHVRSNTMLRVGLNGTQGSRDMPLEDYKTMEGFFSDIAAVWKDHEVDERDCLIMISFDWKPEADDGLLMERDAEFGLEAFYHEINCAPCWQDGSSTCTLYAKIYQKF